MKYSMIPTGIFLTIGNFLYQALAGSHDWSVAVDRSYFQWVAILCVWIAIRMHKSWEASK